MDKKLIILSGFIGGMGPSLAEFASLCKTQTHIPHPLFFVGAIIMGILGAVLVAIAKETVPWKAFTQGIGVPAIFSSATTAVTSVAFLNFVPAVYAQDSIKVDSTHLKADTVVVIIDGDSLIHKELVGNTIAIAKEDLSTIYKVPASKDTIRIKVKIYDPVIRRAFVQGLMPMQKSLSDQYERRLIVEEEKK